jgi:predicted transcriptional regulator
MIYEASVGDSTVITGENMLLAIALIERVTQDIKELVDNQISFDQQTKERNIVKKIIKDAKKPIPHSLILKNSHLESKRVKEILTTLVESGLVALAEGELNKYGAKYISGN